MKKKMQWGGTAESSETGEFIGGENASSMYNTGGGVDSLSKQNKEILAKELYGKKYSDCDTEQKEAIKAELELGKFSPRWNKLFKESKFSKTAYAKGGGLKGKAKYVPNYMVQSVEVERKGKTTEIDGANILDGVYVKKGVKFANGGAMNETFPENDAMSYAKGGGVSHYKVGNEIFIDYMDAVSYCDKKNLPYSKIIKTKKYEDGGSTSGWCYSIGGL